MVTIKFNINISNMKDTPPRILRGKCRGKEMGKRKKEKQAINKVFKSFKEIFKY